ncbi:hypothetical protein JCM10908_004984 [Rhodotorula pacifica]|uniref:N-acetylglucosaminylphosphatidylinositol deacetylase n=1 Tax=Rhodotorula pacifica TaxID=1495444 RepID=UPI0031715BD7
MLHANRRISRFWRRAVPIYLLATLLATLCDLRLPSTLHRAESILWVIAHPDDESFFFAPAILNLLDQTDRLGALLCLSIGDHEGRGRERVRELQASCQILGIPSDRCVAVDAPTLQDKPDAWWPAADIQVEVETWAAIWEPDVIMTFDAYGVSGHINHRAIGAALHSWQPRQTNRTIPVYALQSTNVLAKFTSLLLLPPLLLRRTLFADNVDGSAYFVSSFRRYRLALASFHAHRSQARWFRTLFIYFSRYLWYVDAVRVA